ncbi:MULTISPECIES: hypothetical protein [Nocardia]|uniref:hypothetical protein n=1 Tax=Nocardia TaxID=1817 RepID=UPI000D690970|nr:MULTISPECIES: hypothetical protein [Nocardia]
MPGGRPLIDISGERIGSFTVVEFDRLEKGHRYWILECDCGNQVSRIPSHMRKNKIQKCQPCSSGTNHHAFHGVGEFPQSHYRSTFHSAQAKGLEFEVSKEYLWQLYLDQDRRCAFTGWPIHFAESYRKTREKTASLDRIDSSVGYIEGNLQWVHRDVNKLKKNMADERFIELCHAVAAHTQVTAQAA